MTHLKLTPAEEKRLADAFVAQALAMGLKGNRTLPKAVKQQVRERVLRAIQDEREARRAQEMRREIRGGGNHLHLAAAAPPVRGIYHKPVVSIKKSPHSGLQS
ncbi:Uncharacterised protein [Klebsiella pneumoniae]|nr:Uncharacterised protein [Klebsiella pneumoniae]